MPTRCRPAPPPSASTAAILLTDGSTEPLATAFYVWGHPTDYAVGGLPAFTGADRQPTATYGSDLYGTDAAVAAQFFPNPTSFARPPRPT